MKSTIVQCGATAFISAKVLAVLPTIAFAASLQMSAQWKRQKYIYTMKIILSSQTTYLVSGIHIGQQNYFENCSKLDSPKIKIILQYHTKRWVILDEINS